jgi:probable F420-dependent oxidoreductase
MSPRPFRFGVMTSGRFEATGWRELVRRVDELGYDVLNMPNHRAAPGLSPLVAMASAAEISSRLRFGTLVLDNESVDPGVIAKDTATLDVLSEGRLEVGIGAGWLPADHTGIGQPWRRPGERIERLAEAIAVLKECWTEDTASRPSPVFPLDAIRNEPRPVQQPHPPILIGGGGERVLRLAGRLADIVSFVPNMAAGRLGPDTAADGRGDALSRKLAWVHEAAGDRMAGIELHTNLTQVILTDDRAGGLAKVKRGYGLEADDDAAALAVPHAVVGTAEQMADQLLERRARTGISYYSVFEPGMEAFAPVQALLIGA